MSDTRELRKHLTAASLEIGALLNTVTDDDERDSLHGHIEKVINDELHAGSVNRAAFAPVSELLERLRRRGSVVVDLGSRRVPKDAA